MTESENLQKIKKIATIVGSAAAILSALGAGATQLYDWGYDQGKIESELEIHEEYDDEHDELEEKNLNLLKKLRKCQRKNGSSRIQKTAKAN